jgi:hypothetical protein
MADKKPFDMEHYENVTAKEAYDGPDLSDVDLDDLEGEVDEFLEELKAREAKD